MIDKEVLQDDAIEFLVKRGVVIPNRDAAVDLATDIAIEECITESKSHGDMISFDGDEYCEECAGWDGESRRCECGNRRVYWEAGWDVTFKNMYVFPSVY